MQRDPLGDWRGGGVAAAARAFTTPPVAYPVDRHAGSRPTSATLLSLTDPSIMATALRVRDDEVQCRVFNMEGTGSDVPARTVGLRRQRLSSLAGDTIDHLRPYGIGALLLARATTDG